MSTLKDELREMIANAAKRPPEEIGDDVSLLEGLEIDSLAMLDLMAEMEKRYEVRFTNEQIFSIVDLNSLVTAIEDLRQAKPAPVSV